MTTIVTRAGKGDTLSWVEVDTNFTNLNTDKLEHIVSDTTPQLGGNLDVNGNSIVSTSNANIAISPNGTGKVVLDGVSWPGSDGSANQVLTTNGSGTLSWTTPSGGASMAKFVATNLNIPFSSTVSDITTTLTQVANTISSNVSLTSGYKVTLTAGTYVIVVPTQVFSFVDTTTFELYNETDATQIVATIKVSNEYFSSGFVTTLTLTANAVILFRGNCNTQSNQRLRAFSFEIFKTA